MLKISRGAPPYSPPLGTPMYDYIVCTSHNAMYYLLPLFLPLFQTTSFFLDLAVYSRNRNFRILFSSKLSTARPLLPDPKWPPGSPLSPAELFLRSLVTYVSSDTRPLLLPWSCVCGGPLQSFPLPSRPSEQNSPVSSDLSGSGSSLFPEIDAFLMREVLRGSGKVRRWSYLPKRELLTYDLCGNRFCHRIGRPHRSNNVM